MTKRFSLFFCSSRRLTCEQSRTCEGTMCDKSEIRLDPTAVSLDGLARPFSEIPRNLPRDPVAELFDSSTRSSIFVFNDYLFEHKRRHDVIELSSRPVNRDPFTACVRVCVRQKRLHLGSVSHCIYYTQKKQFCYCYRDSSGHC